MEFIFWHNIVSPHAVPLVKSIAEAGHPSTFVSFEEMTEDRLKLGWSALNVLPARLVVKPDELGVSAIIEHSDTNAIHVIAGARVNAWGATIARLCRRHGRRFGIISESPDPRGPIGYLRRVKYRVERNLIGRHFDFVLSMGEKGRNWFQERGYAERLVFPLSYTPAVDSGDEYEIERKYAKIVFVGQLIPRKGVDLLIEAFSRIATDCDVELLILGSGNDEGAYRLQAANLSVGARISWLGAVPNKEVSRFICNSDVLVLPSREDGWGAVVNEALMLGTPVVCSSACGAADLLRKPWRGTVFASESVEDLTAALAFWTGRGRADQAQRQVIKNWAKRISAASVSRYFIEVMDHVYGHAPRPTPPWET